MKDIKYLVGAIGIASALSGILSYQHRDIPVSVIGSYDDASTVLEEQAKLFINRLENLGPLTAKPSHENAFKVLQTQHLAVTSDSVSAFALSDWASMLRAYERTYAREIASDSNFEEALDFWKTELAQKLSQSVQRILSLKEPSNNIEAINIMHSFNALCETLDYIDPKAKETAKALNMHSEEWLKASYAVSQGYENLLQTPAKCVDMSMQLDFSGV